MVLVGVQEVPGSNPGGPTKSLIVVFHQLARTLVMDANWAYVAEQDAVDEASEPARGAQEIVWSACTSLVMRSVTTVPVGMWVIRTAESVVFTL